MKRRWAVVAIAAGVLAVIACSSSSETPPEDVTGACRAIASACHRYDDGKNVVASECHTLGHDTADDVACARRKAECLAACPTPPGKEDGGHPVEVLDAARETDGEAGPPVDVCESYCDCLDGTCATQAGYPHASRADCVTACNAFSAEQKVCWPKFCAQAKAGVSKTHNCEHAWGKLGLDECESL